MANQSHGFDNTVVGGVETTQGQSATDFKWLGMIESFEPEENNNIDQRLTVGSRAPIKLRYGQTEVDGSIAMGVQNARFLALALGKFSTTGDDTSGYTHEITTIGRGEVLPSITIQNHNMLHGLTRNYVGGKVDSFTLTASAEEAVTLEADMLFTHVEDQGITPANVVADLENYFMFYEGSIKVNGTEVLDITEFELEVSNGLERKFTIQQGNRARRIEEGNLEITSSLTFDFVDTSQWDIFRNSENLEVELTLQDSQDPNHMITIHLSGGLYDTNSLPVSAEDLQEQELEAIFTGISVTAKDGNADLL